MTLMPGEPRCDHPSGAYRRVYTLPGYAGGPANAMWADARLPVGAPGNGSTHEIGNLANNPRSNVETPYVYVGGWGAGRYRGQPIGSVDAGFQYSKVDAHWLPFLAVERAPWVTFPGAPRIPGGSEVKLLFLAQDNRVGFAFRVGQGPTVGPIWAQTDPRWGWNAAGRDLVFKRMTSIAQVPFAEALGTRRSYIRRVGWSPTYLGIYDGRSYSGQRRWTSAFARTCHFPRRGQKLGTPPRDYGYVVRSRPLGGSKWEEENAVDFSSDPG